MKFLNEIKFFLSAIVEMGKKIWMFILIANLAFAYFFISKGYSDISGLLLQFVCITIFIPLILTLKNEVGG